MPLLLYLRASTIHYYKLTMSKRRKEKENKHDQILDEYMTKYAYQCISFFCMTAALPKGAEKVGRRNPRNPNGEGTKINRIQDPKQVLGVNADTRLRGLNAVWCQFGSQCGPTPQRSQRYLMITELSDLSAKEGFQDPSLRPGFDPFLKHGFDPSLRHGFNASLGLFFLLLCT